jgi:hypothetical protein
MTTKLALKKILKGILHTEEEEGHIQAQKFRKEYTSLE